MIAADGTAVYPWNHGETLTAAALNAAIAQALQASSSDFANITDYGAGLGGDDAAAFRAALASGQHVIFVPPGTYTFKTLATVPGPMSWQPTPCVLFNGVSNLTVLAYGATFLIDNAATFPDGNRANAGNAHCAFIGNCQNVVWKGGRFYGNTTNAGTAINTGMWFQNCTGVLVEDTEWLGSYPQAPIFGGTWMFDCTFRNNRSYGSGNGFDFAFCESLTLMGNRFDGAQIAGSVASCGFKLFTDPASKTFNTAGQTLAQSTWLPSGTVRQLRGGVSNNIRLIGNIFAGWITGVFLDGVDGAVVSNNTVRDGITGGSGAGITVTTSSDTTTAGYVTTDIVICENEIYANNNPGVQIVPGTNGIGSISVVDNRIYDNLCANAITFGNTTSVGTFRLTGNDFNTRTSSTRQTAPYAPATLAAIGAIYRSNLGVTPYDTLSGGRVMSVLPGSNASVAVSDGTNAVGMFISGGGLGLGPMTYATAAPSAEWVHVTALTLQFDAGLPSATSDSAAAGLGVAVGGLYSNAGVVHIRLT